MSMTTAERIAALSRWIDNSVENACRDPEARTWGRIAKVAEECGEVIQAYIGVTAQNPRKGKYGTKEDVKKELLDVAVTALAAYEHLDGNQGHCIDDLLEFVWNVSKRAELE